MQHSDRKNQMASPENYRVLNHIRALYAERFFEGQDVDSIVAGNRALMAEYANVGGIRPVLAPETEITPVRARGVPCEWVRAAGADPNLRLYWIHGGGWISGSPADYRHVAEALSRYARASVMAVDYRLAPEHPFPAGLDDCLAAYRWLLDHGPEGPGKARSSWIAGDSAGGNLSLALLLKLRDAGEPMPAAVATLGAATDLTGSGASMESRAALDPMISKQGVDFVARLYVQDSTPLIDPLVSPLFGDLRDLPPLLMHVGDHEALLDDSVRFAERAVAAGSLARVKVWPEMIHVFESFCHVLPEGRQSLEEIGEFLAGHSG